MEFKTKANLFLSVYFSLLAGHAHLATVVNWRNLAQLSFDWKILSFLMTSFWVSHFLVALFPSSLLLRLFSCVSLYYVWKETFAFSNWIQFSYFFVHIWVSLAPQLTIRGLDKLKCIFSNHTYVVYICLFFLMAFSLGVLRYGNVSIYLEWFYLLISLLLVFFYCADLTRELNDSH